MSAVVNNVPQVYWDEYYIHPDGQVYSIKSQRFLKHLATNGYRHVVLCGPAGKKRFAVHRLVATVFIRNPKSLEVINHKNGDRADNRVENLEWCSQSANVLHAYETGLRNIDQEHRRRAAALGRSKRKLTAEQAAAIRKAYTGARGEITRLALEYRIDRTCVRDIVNGDSYV